MRLGVEAQGPDYNGLQLESHGMLGGLDRKITAS
jgi:hypothetical protein